MLIRLGHSPDPDDAFMFWGLASGEVDPRQFEFEHVLRDIQTLNKWALEWWEQQLELSAEGRIARDYLKGREITDETRKTFLARKCSARSTGN